MAVVVQAENSLPNLDTTYSIDGFRSLREFEITLKPGVNVLVGPNGSGKTNYIDFLDFLDNTLRQGASTAVSRAGGVAKVFSIENIRKSSPSVFAHVTGIAELTEDMLTAPKNSIFNFEYEIEIKFSRTHSSIFIAKETLKVGKLRALEEDQLASATVGIVAIHRTSPLEEMKPKRRVGARLMAETPRNPFNVRYNFNNGVTPKKALERIEPSLLAPDESLFSTRHMIPAIEAVRSALTRGRSFNIIPARAREPDDLTQVPGIGRDGAGLSSTLHHLQVAKRNRNSRRMMRLRKVTTDSLDMVIEWTRLVFPELQDISVTQDPHTGKYLAYLTVRSDDTLKIPLQSASDGTLKWLSFVCLLVSSGGTYSLEEPENFLHPKMQQFLIQLIRDSLSNDARAGYFILSTHSETLINQCNVEELILFEFKDGTTTCSRLRDPERVKGEINRTGFGLGYYYANNAIS